MMAMSKGRSEYWKGPPGNETRKCSEHSRTMAFKVMLYSEVPNECPKCGFGFLNAYYQPRLASKPVLEWICARCCYQFESYPKDYKPGEEGQ